MTKERKARAHLARAQVLLQGRLGFGGDRQTTLDVPSKKPAYNQFGPPSRERETHRYHPYGQRPEESHCELSSLTFESVAHELIEQVDYKIMSGEYDSGWRIVYLGVFTFQLYNVANPQGRTTFRGPAATFELADAIKNHIPNAWIEELDGLAQNHPNLRWNRM